MHSFAWVMVLALVAPAADAQIHLDDDGKLTLFGDLRLRFEDDWDSVRSDGAQRDERGRMRVRARIGLHWTPAEGLALGFRLRTGLRSSQQSPHLTFWDFDDNGADPLQLSFDRWFVQFGEADTKAWFGKNTDPFWKQNELFWDDDVSLTGGTLIHGWDGRSSDVRFVGGAFILPDGASGFAGSLLAGQLVYDYQGAAMGTTAATGLFVIRGSDHTRYLRNGNGARDYKIWTAHAQARVSGSRLPVTLGFDFMHNFEGYSPNDPDEFTAAHHDQTTGFVASVALGGIRKRWEWLAAYYYAYIETFAVNASFAEDDWMRWGADGQTDSSDFKGHELRFAIAVHPHANVFARYYLVEAITTMQHGKRFRIDLNYRF